MQFTSSPPSIVPPKGISIPRTRDSCHHLSCATFHPHLRAHLNTHRAFTVASAAGTTLKRFPIRPRLYPVSTPPYSPCPSSSVETSDVSSVGAFCAGSPVERCRRESTSLSVDRSDLATEMCSDRGAWEFSARASRRW